MAAALSLPPLARGGGGGGIGGGGGARARRKPRHVSAFRERILEERRVRKEVCHSAGVHIFVRASLISAPGGVPWWVKDSRRPVTIMLHIKTALGERSFAGKEGGPGDA